MQNLASIEQQLVTQDMTAMPSLPASNMPFDMVTLHGAFQS